MKPRTFSAIKDGLIPSDFLHSALDHMDAAKLLFDSTPDHYDSGGYLAHIAVELLIKAWLLETANEFEGVHNLEALYEQLVKKHGVPQLSKEHQTTIKMLDQFEQLRYPNTKAPVEVGGDDFLEIVDLFGHLYRSMPQEIPKGLDQFQTGHIRKGGRVLMEIKIE